MPGGHDSIPTPARWAWATIAPEPRTPQEGACAKVGSVKHCPYCAEVIQAAAVKCRFCGEWLDPSKRPSQSNSSSESESNDDPPSLGVPMPRSQWPDDAGNSSRAMPTLGGGTTENVRKTQALVSLGATHGSSEAPAPERTDREAWAPPAWLAPEPRTEGSSTLQEQAEKLTRPIHLPSIPTATEESATPDEVAIKMERIRAAAAKASARGSESEPVKTLGLAPMPDFQRVGNAKPVVHPVAGVVGLSKRSNAASDFLGEELGGESRAGVSHVGGHSLSDDDPFRDAASAAPKPLPWPAIAIAAALLAGLTLIVMKDQLFPSVPSASEAAAIEPVRNGAVATLESDSVDAPPPSSARAVSPVPSEREPVESAPPGSHAPMVGNVSDSVPTAPSGAGGGAQARSAPTSSANEAALADKLANARTLYKRRKLKAARGSLQEVLEISPDNADALLLLAQVQLEHNELAPAKESANRCVRVAPDKADCWLTLGVLQQNEKDTAAAIEAYERYLSLAPSGTYARDAKKQLTRLKK